MNETFHFDDISSNENVSLLVLDWVNDKKSLYPQRIDPPVDVYMEDH